jgi:DNA-binding IclR family transcriptional regulator
MSEREYRFHSLEASLDVIEAFLTGDGAPLGVTEISQRLNLNKSRVFRILSTLTSRGYVRQDPQTQKYRLGPGFLAVGEAVRRQFALQEAAEPFLVELAERTGDAVYLAVRAGTGSVSISRHQGHHVLQVTTPVGQALPLHIGGCPKLLLAYLPEAEQEHIVEEMVLTRFTPNTITDRDELRRHLAQIRAQGFAIDEEDFEPGVYVVGAPVWDFSGHVVAGISVATHAGRWSADRREELIALVVDAAGRLSTQLGFGRGTRA